MFTQKLLMSVLCFVLFSFSRLVLAQTDPDTVTGCLSRGNRPGFYTVREEGTSFTITVTGSDDLQKYSAGSKVKSTGKMSREQGTDLFRVTSVEQLSPNCEATFPLHLSVEGTRQAVGRATWGYVVALALIRS